MSINHHWSVQCVTYITHLRLLHRTPDNFKAQLITRSCRSVESINFLFYFDYLLAFGALRLCSRLKHLTIGEGGLTWIAGANASNQQQQQRTQTANTEAMRSVVPNIASALNIPSAMAQPPVDGPPQDNNNPQPDNHTNGNNLHTHSVTLPEQSVISPPEEMKLLIAKATSAANMAADAANEANNCANNASNAAHLASKAVASALAALSSLNCHPLQPVLQSALTAVTDAVHSANDAVVGVVTAANAAASAANASSIAAGMAGHVYRYNNTVNLHNQNNNNGNNNHNGYDTHNNHTNGNMNGKHKNDVYGGDSFSARQIKTLRVTSGRSDKKVIPEFKHLFLFSNLKKLELDGSISTAHLESVMLSARQLQLLRINCSDSGNELHALRHSVSLKTLILAYFSPLFVSTVGNVPSLNTLRLSYTNQHPQLVLQQLAGTVVNGRKLYIFHPRFSIPPQSKVEDSELMYLCKFPLLDALYIQLPNCDVDMIGQLPLTTLRVLGTSMLLPVYPV